MKMIKKNKESKQEINTKLYLKNKKNEKREYGRNRYHMSEKKKQKQKEFQKKLRWN